MQQNRTSQEHFSRLIEALKAEQEAIGMGAGPNGEPPAASSRGYRYPRSRWSAPSAE